MAVASSSAFNPAATQLLTAIFRILGVINEDEIPSAGMYANGMFVLNGMMKAMEADGIHIWTEEEGIIFLQKGQRTYLLGGTTTDKACNAMDWIQTTMAQSAATATLAMVVTDSDGMTVGDNFGVVLNDGSAFWSTIDTIVGDTVTLVDATTGPVTSGTPVMTYPPASQLVRPLDIPFCRRLQYQTQPGVLATQAPDWGGIITPVSPMSSRQDYMDLPQPNNPGLVTQVFYNPGRDQGQLWVWNCSTNALYALRFTYYRPLLDFVTGNNTGDFPQEWIEPIQWMLAFRLAPQYSVPAERWDRIKVMAMEMNEKVQGWDREHSSIYFGRSSPNSR